MATTVISAKYPPQIDITKTPTAYGDRALPRLNRELNDNILLTRQRALMSLCDILHDPEYIASALREGISISLKKLLSDADNTVRQKTTQCLYIIAQHSIGRDAFLADEVITPLAELFNDKDEVARRNAHQAIEMISETPVGAAGIVDAKLVPILVQKLTSETDEIKELILHTLHFCMRVDTQPTLDADAMTVFTELLEHKRSSVRAKAARDIMDLSVPLSGKDKAVEVQSVKLLIRLLHDEDMDVRANAAGAIMSITVTTKGKYTALEGDAIGALVELVEDPSSEVRANTLKALTCLSEAPEGRKALLSHVEQIRKRMEDPIPAVVKAATTAVKVITWKP